FSKRRFAPRKTKIPGASLPHGFLNVFHHSRRSLPVPASLPVTIHQPINQLILFGGTPQVFNLIRKISMFRSIQDFEFRNLFRCFFLYICTGNSI
ncbi:MAG: hypothetical protein Q8914_09305, partial [Bacteroidota bacterium]|nr:hypothetical protein [Bacteroidota bacterium]